MFWSRTFNPSKDLVDLSGKIVIVTGANTGIGYETARQLARAGAKVYVGSRSAERGEKAVAQLKQEGTGAGDVVSLSCDLSAPTLAKQSAEGFLQLESRLDILVNNAAILYDEAPGSKKTAQDGITEMMMVNHIGLFQFAITLLPLMVKTSEAPGSDVRVVTVSSRAHAATSASLNPEIDFSSLEGFKNHHENERFPTYSRYSVSKLANVLFAICLQRRVSSSSIISISLHPGLVNTPTPSKLSFPRLAGFILSIIGYAPEAGAYTSVFAAASPVVREQADKYEGAYLVPFGNIARASDNALNAKLQDDLWKTTEEYINGQGSITKQAMTTLLLKYHPSIRLYKKRPESLKKFSVCCQCLLKYLRFL